MVQGYVQAGYNGVIVTNHYFKPYFNSLPASLTWEEKVKRYWFGYEAAHIAAKEMDFLVLPGAEITFFYHMNDYLLFGLTERFLIENPELFNWNIYDLYRKVKENGLMLFQAHPFRTNLMYRTPNHLIDGMEIYNGSKKYNPYIEKTAAYINKNGLRSISGSDFHTMEGIARGGIETHKKIHNNTDLLRILYNREYTPIIPNKPIE